jgi:predicted amidohydrolase
MAIKDLSVSIIQTDLVWENIDENLKNFETLIESIDTKTDLIVLPEMFTTGFSMNPEKLFEKPEGRTLKWLKLQAKKTSAAIVGSVIVKEDTHYFNRLFFVQPDGSYDTYDKKHLFTLAGEHENYSPGKKRLIVHYKGWRICPFICYDLRFPVWARYQEDYDVLIYVANWPERRIKAWDTLLQARAIENMSYCVGVNRIGQDGNNYPYVGHSAIYDVLGHQLSTPDFEKEFVDTQNLSYEKLISVREKLGFLNDRDNFRVN